MKTLAEQYLLKEINHCMLKSKTAPSRFLLVLLLKSNRVKRHGEVSLSELVGIHFCS